MNTIRALRKLVEDSDHESAIGFAARRQLAALEADRELLRAYGSAMVENGRGIGAAWCLPEVQERALELAKEDPR